MKRKKGIAVSIVLVLLFIGGCNAGTLSDSLDKKTKETAEYLMEKSPSPGIGPVGGDWTVKGIAESGQNGISEYMQIYYDNVRAKVKSSKGEIHDAYYSDYARVVIGLESIGKDATDVEGYDLTNPLNEYDELTEQGCNAVSYALVAANVAGVELKQEKAYVSFLISELENLLSIEENSVNDYVSMALLGLSFYQEEESVSEVIGKGILYLSKYQNDDGSMGNCESTAEAIVALSQLGIDVFEDDRFVKNKNSLGESIMEYEVGEGAFSHTEEKKKENLMASEKAMLALDSIKKQQEGQKLY